MDFVGLLVWFFFIQFGFSSPNYSQSIKINIDHSYVRTIIPSSHSIILKIVGFIDAVTKEQKDDVNWYILVAWYFNPRIFNQNLQPQSFNHFEAWNLRLQDIFNHSFFNPRLFSSIRCNYIWTFQPHLHTSWIGF